MRKSPIATRPAAIGNRTAARGLFSDKPETGMGASNKVGPFVGGPRRGGGEGAFSPSSLCFISEGCTRRVDRIDHTNHTDHPDHVDNLQWIL